MIRFTYLALLLSAAIGFMLGTGSSAYAGEAEFTATATIVEPSEIKYYDPNREGRKALEKGRANYHERDAHTIRVAGAKDAYVMIDVDKMDQNAETYYPVNYAKTTGVTRSDDGATIINVAELLATKGYHDQDKSVLTVMLNYN